jgi:serine/threonine-protein kinase
VSLEVGQILDDKYEIKRLIGKGGMGNVYEGENVLIHRRVAIKVLNADVAEDTQTVKRFEREAQAAGRIGSDHIVEVLDLGRLPSGERYMVMEYLQGESLRMRMERVGQMAPEEAFPILVGMLDGLDDAHAAGILHRDLKPANVFLTSDREQPDFVKILDFGVSKFMHLSGDDATTTGQMLGTPRYMAPEQAKGEKDIDFRADIYSAGVIMFRALAARPPYLADTYNELMFKIVLEDPPRLSEVREDIDPAICNMVAKAMSRDRSARYDSAAELAGELRTWLRERGLELSSPGSTRRQRLSSSDISGPLSLSLSRAEAPTEISNTKHATTMAPEAPRPRRRTWLVAAAALVALGIAGVTSHRLTRPRGDVTPASATTGNARTTPTGQADGTAEPSASAEPDASSDPEASATASAAASASASADASAEPTSTAAPPPARPPNWQPPAKPSPKPSGPSRTYRRTL